MKIIKYIALIIIVGLAIFIWFSSRATGNDLVTVTIGGRDYRALLADQPAEWERGLSGQTKHQMMLFVFPDKQLRTFWMKDMNFPIDIVWLDDTAVVGVERASLIPDGIPQVAWPRYSSAVPINQVLEIPIDLKQNLGLNIENGDKINIKL
ncbi:MAG: hypothetical protein C3F02_03565 [Parcubacteria group bacterium]|nr:MAG: hypothetical protein C3F02_03565 [Parcubacteria group bacterium]